MKNIIYILLLLLIIIILLFDSLNYTIPSNIRDMTIETFSRRTSNAKRTKR